MKCPKCGSATWTDNLNVKGKSVPIHRCFCGWTSRPDVKAQPLGPRFLDKVIMKHG